jgi:hypothetical protein
MGVLGTKIGVTNIQQTSSVCRICYEKKMIYQAQKIDKITEMKYL